LETLVEADTPEQACSKTIKAANQENGYGPKKDGGFMPVVAYTRSGLLRMVEQLGGPLQSFSNKSNPLRSTIACCQSANSRNQKLKSHGLRGC
jgi:hypothetical protein